MAALLRNASLIVLPPFSTNPDVSDPTVSDGSPAPRATQDYLREYQAPERRRCVRTGALCENTSQFAIGTGPNCPSAPRPSTFRRFERRSRNQGQADSSPIRCRFLHPSTTCTPGTSSACRGLPMLWRKVGLRRPLSRLVPPKTPHAPRQSSPAEAPYLACTRSRWRPPGRPPA